MNVVRQNQNRGRVQSCETRDQPNCGMELREKREIEKKRIKVREKLKSKIAYISKTALISRSKFFCENEKKLYNFLGKSQKGLGPF